jgi:hypothetical protein
MLKSHKPKINVEAEWESPEEAAQRCNLSRQSIYNIMGRGLITAKKFGGKTLINISSRRAYMASLPDAKVKPPNKPKHAETTA